jgi:low affinity Fe/Cu permease
MNSSRDMQPGTSRARNERHSLAGHAFSRFSTLVARKSGHIVPFFAATVFVVLWGVSGPIAHWSDTWQLVMNTVSSAVTFLMVFVIQGSQNRDTEMINAKLNEIIRALPEARKEFLKLDDLSESQLRRLNATFGQSEGLPE